MSMIKFNVTLQPGRAGSTHRVLVVLSPEQSARLGSKRAVNITGTLNGAPFRNSFLPAGGGRHYLVVSGALQKAAGLNVGDRAVLTFEIETAPRPVDVPEDVQAALAKSRAAQKAWEALPPSHRREYLGYITEAKKAETRARRIAQTIDRLKAG